MAPLGEGARARMALTADSDTVGPLDVRAVWQLTSMAMGAGVFTIPSVFVRLGVVQAAMWVLALATLANFAMQRLLDAAAQHAVDSYEGLAERAFGRAGKVMMCFITFMTTFIASLSYVSAAKELLVNLAAAFLVDLDVNASPDGVQVLGEVKSIVVLVMMVLFVMPSCLKSTLGDNAWISQLGVFCVFFSVAVFLVRCAVMLARGCSPAIHCGPAPSAFAGSVGDLLEYTATLAFSFSMVFALFPVLQERVAEQGSVAAVARSLRRPVMCSVALSSASYLAIGLVGSLAFGGATKPIALSNLPLSEPLTQLISLMVGVSVELLVAIVAFPAVQSLEFLLGLCLGGRFGGQLRPFVVGLLGVLMVLVDTLLPTKAAFTLCGSLGLSLGSYVMPCLLYLRLAGAGGEAGAPPAKRFPVFVVLGFGLMLLLASTPVTLARLLGDSDPGPQPPELRSLLCSLAGKEEHIEL